MFNKFWDPRTARILCTALIFVIIFAFLRGARETLTLFLFAILFAYFVEPLVARLERPLRGRIKAIAGVYLILIAVVVGLGFLVGPKIGDEAKDLSLSLPSLLDRMGSGQLVSSFGQHHGWTSERQQQIQNFFLSHRSDLLGYGRVIGAKLAEPVQKIWWLILIPILSLFFLKDGRSMAESIVETGDDPNSRTVLRGIVQDVNVMLGSYIRAQLILACLTLVVYTLVLSLMRVPYAFILGPLAGIFEFVPVVGPAIAAVTVVVIAVLTGYPHYILLIVFLGIWRLLQDYVNSPRIMGASLEISPIVQIFAVLAGGEIGGVVGALISVPVTAILRILWRRMSEHSDNEDRRATQSARPRIVSTPAATAVSTTIAPPTPAPSPATASSVPSPS